MSWRKSDQAMLSQSCARCQRCHLFVCMDTEKVHIHHHWASTSPDIFFHWPTPSVVKQGNRSMSAPSWQCPETCRPSGRRPGGWWCFVCSRTTLGLHKKTAASPSADLITDTDFLRVLPPGRLVPRLARSWPSLKLRVTHLPFLSWLWKENSSSWRFTVKP